MFSAGIERALRVAIAAHNGQLRKGAGEVPYVVHPIHAAVMLARMGSDDETIQAAILHDVVEDSDDWTLERLESEFGARVRLIVADLTEDKSKSWGDRKRWAVEHTAHMLPEAATVKAADKLHNLRSLLDELRSAPDPETVWPSFKGGRDGTLRVAEELIAALVPRIDARLARALEETLAALREIA